MIGDPTDGALVALAENGGRDRQTTRERYPRVAELPFDTAYKLMATFHEMDGVVRCLVKGAPDQLLGRASSHLDPALEVAAIDDAFTQRYLDENKRLVEQGLRGMAAPRRDVGPATSDPKTDLLALMEDLPLLARVGILAPPHPTAKDAITEAHAAGI